MRTLVEPPPSSRCDKCGGELRLKLIESASHILDLDNQIFVCAKCGGGQLCTVSHNLNVRHMPDPKAAWSSANRRREAASSLPALAPHEVVSPARPRLTRPSRG
jgi:hypothetical protein